MNKEENWKKRILKETKIISNYLHEVVKNSHRCQHCCHNNNFCPFAYDCIKKDFYYWEEED